MKRCLMHAVVLSTNSIWRRKPNPSYQQVLLLISLAPFLGCFKGLRAFFYTLGIVLQFTRS